MKPAVLVTAFLLAAGVLAGVGFLAGRLFSAPPPEPEAGGDVDAGGAPPVDPAADAERARREQALAEANRKLLEARDAHAAAEPARRAAAEAEAKRRAEELKRAEAELAQSRAEVESEMATRREQEAKAEAEKLAAAADELERAEAEALEKRRREALDEGISALLIGTSWDFGELSVRLDPGGTAVELEGDARGSWTVEDAVLNVGLGSPTRGILAPLTATVRDLGGDTVELLDLAGESLPRIIK